MSRTLIALLSAASIFVVSADGQGTFQNLDFEAAQLIFVDPPTNMFIATADALPGWTAFAGTNALSIVQYRKGGFFPPLALSDNRDFVIGGNFCVFLYVSGGISQTGLIPADAKSLLFSIGRFGQPQVFVAGIELPYSTITTGLDYTVFGADVSGFAGQTATLSFLGGGNSFSFFLDDIQFSSQPIPEPSVLFLILLASGAFACFRSRAGPRLKKFARP